MAENTVQMNTAAIDNPLALKLQKRFSERGVNAPGLAQSMSTGEVMRRVSAGLDPYERSNQYVADHAADDEVTRMAPPRQPVQNVRVDRRPAAPAAAAAPVRTARPAVRTVNAGTASLRSSDDVRVAYPGRHVRTLDYVDRGSRARSRAFEDLHNRGFVIPENTRVPGYTKAYDSAEAIRNTATEFYRKRSRELEQKTGIYSVPVIGSAVEVIGDAAVSAGEKLRQLWRRISDARSVSEERIVTNRRSIPVGAIVLALVFAILLMVIIYSFSQVNEIKNEISEMSAAQSTLMQTRDELSLELEMRDDIRLIRQIATEKLGMVSSDAVESKYVSVSGGDRIELVASDPETNASADSLFSLFAGRLSALKYYFK